MKKLFTLLALSLLTIAGYAQEKKIVLKPVFATTLDTETKWGYQSVDNIPEQYIMKQVGTSNLYTCTINLDVYYKSNGWRTYMKPAYDPEKPDGWTNTYNFQVVSTDNFGYMPWNSEAKHYGDAISKCQSFTLSEDNTNVTFYATIDADGKVHSTCDAMDVNIGDTNWATFVTLPHALGATSTSANFSNDNSSFQTIIIIDSKSKNSNYYWQDTNLNTSSKPTWKVGTGVVTATLDYTTFNINFTKAESYDLKVSSAKAATLVFPQAATIPAGVKAYTLNYTGGENVTATEVEGTIPANTPVLVNAEPGTYSFALDATADYTVDPVSGALTGVYTKTTVPQNSYVLQNHEGKVGFYKVSTDDITLNPFRAYLSVEEASAAKINIVFPEATGITSVKNTTVEDNVLYNIAGQRVGNDYRGIVIKNGKKFFNK